MTLKNPSGFKWCEVVQSGAKWCKVVQSGAKWFFQLQVGAEWRFMTKNQNDLIFKFLLFANNVTQLTVKNDPKTRAWLDNFKHSSQERSVERA